MSDLLVRCFGDHNWSEPYQDTFNRVTSWIMFCNSCGRIQAFYPGNYFYTNKGEVVQVQQQGWSIGGKDIYPE